ncbi:MAG: ATP-binding protein [Steroidobacteraceae bacterium]
MSRAHTSVRWKFVGVVLLTTAIALLVAGGALLTRDISSYRQAWTADLETEAGVLALSTAPALAFDDHATAIRNVAALQALPAVIVAAIYRTDGKLYAQYVKTGEPPAPQQLPAELSGTPRFSHGDVMITRRVMSNGEWVGTIYLRGRYDVMARVVTYLEILGVVIFLSMLIALALSTALQRVITRPLDAMAAIARHVITTRDYSPRAKKTTDDEIGMVVDAFNAMLDEVESRTRALERSNGSLQGEVANRLAAEGALREADRRKDEFLATLAHELRNPLAPIRNAVKLLESPAADERRKQWSREVIARQAQRMALLLDDLLDVSRITRGRLTLRREISSLATIVGSAVETARPLIDSKGHALEVRLPSEALELEADPLRLSQVLCNLLTNAAKYTDAGGRITLTGTLEASGLTFTVTDNGIGLSASSIPTLFEMFSQVDSAIDRAEGGLGIGLSLVKGLVGLHGGTVEASSAGPGQGSTFTVRLPRSVIASGRTLPADRASRADPGSAPCSVLIADDNRDAADSLALLLESYGHEAHVAHSGREALDTAARVHPEAFILDIGMPDMTGYELARRVREQPWGRDAMLLAVTGWGQQEDKARAEAAGFDHHLTKPVASNALEELLAHFSKELRARRAADPRVSAC